MKVKIESIAKGDSGLVRFDGGSVVLCVSKRSVLLQNLDIKVGKNFELNLKKER